MSDDPGSRRHALIRLAQAVGIAGGASLLAASRWDHGQWGLGARREERQVRDKRVSADGALDMAIVKATLADPDSDDARKPLVAKLVAAALMQMGGMKRFVSRGDVVAIKPNIGWDRTPLHAANTNPELVAEVAKACFDAGAKRVIVTDASCNDPSRCFQRSGIWRHAHDAGAEVILPSEHRFRNLRMKGDVLDEWPVYTPFLESDKVINLPIAKHHNLSKFTCAMKNWYGLLGGRRNRLHQNIDVSIADLATFMRPTLTIIDGIRVLLRNGPQGGNIDDAHDNFAVVASIDQVAADAYACQWIGQKREHLAYLKLAEDRKIGTMFYEHLRTHEETLTL